MVEVTRRLSVSLARDSHTFCAGGFFSVPQLGGWLIEARVSFVIPRVSGFRQWGNKINMSAYPSVEHVI